MGLFIIQRLAHNLGACVRFNPGPEKDLETQQNRFLEVHEKGKNIVLWFLCIALDSVLSLIFFSWMLFIGYGSLEIRGK